MKRFVILLCFLVSAVSATRSQVPKPSAPATVAIHAGKILDVRTGTYASDQLIWIENGKIKAVGKPADLNKQLPAGTKTIELSNLTVLP
jgi:imidazolonepropionase-like amidohydrolase